MVFERVKFVRVALSCILLIRTQTNFRAIADEYKERKIHVSNGTEELINPGPNPGFGRPNDGLHGKLHEGLDTKTENSRRFNLSFVVEHMLDPKKEAEVMKKIEAREFGSLGTNPVILDLYFRIHMVDKTDHKKVDISTSTKVIIDGIYQEAEYAKILIAARKILIGRYKYSPLGRVKLISLIQASSIKNFVYVRSLSFLKKDVWRIDVVMPLFESDLTGAEFFDAFFGIVHPKGSLMSMSMSKFYGEDISKPDGISGTFIPESEELEDAEKEFLRRYRSYIDQAERGKGLLPFRMPTEGPPTESPHRVVSELERMLFQIPRNIHGYRLSWDDIKASDDMLDLWKLSLTTMSLMSEGDDLETFILKHVFTFKELKDLLEMMYGLIAVRNYESDKKFYDSVGIPREAVEANLEKVRNIFQSKTYTTLARFPPVVKETAKTCPVENMITSLSVSDLISRVQIMLGSWLEEYSSESQNEDNLKVAILCAGTAVMLQQWQYFQIDQGFDVKGIAWSVFIQSFSGIARGRYKNSDYKEKLNDLVKSHIAKECRKYINSAGSVATTSYRGLYRNSEAKSLTGAVGNALGINMESKPLDIATSMSGYFSHAIKKKRVGHALGICLSLQILNKFHGCFDSPGSTDFTLYKLGLLNTETLAILEAFKSSHGSHGASPLGDFIQKACTPGDPTVEETLGMLFKMLSLDAHGMIINVLNQRGFVETEKSEKSDENLFDSEIELNNDFGFDDILGTNEKNNGEKASSFVEIASSMDDNNDDGYYDNTDDGYEFSPKKSFVLKDVFTNKANPDLCSIRETENVDIESMDKIYKQIIVNLLPINLDHFKTIVFDIRVESPLDPQEYFQVKSLSIPISFYKKEAKFINSLSATNFFHLILYRLHRRMEIIKNGLANDALRKRIRSISRLKNKSDITILVDEQFVHGSNDVETYTNLLHLLKSIPRDGYYFESLDGIELPYHSVGEYVANHIKIGHRELSTVVLQLIDPVNDFDVEELRMDAHQILQHDHSLYQILSQ